MSPPEESPYGARGDGKDFLNTPGGYGKEKSLFDELDDIFSKNQRWLDE